MRTGRTLLAASAGAAVAVTAWLLLIPWNLSEVTADGRPIEDGADGSGSQIMLGGVIVLALGLAAVTRASTRGHAAAFVAGGLGAWTALFAWRAAVAETVGANMFMAPLVLVFFPVMIVTPLVVRALAAQLDRNPSATRYHRR